ncbi:SLC13 family permease [Lysobacteraceae bacterium NML75-0749]|nr:SLC13 family permease [Xanthomonadaceae bacterium NML03-0222]PJK02557.1 SLC13 family permease [Xanthomonadaceae bacterium NML91-0268]PJK03171.1 SLC13 family permease [Xanthomonadaceae bacterium NML75-0749]
MMLCDHAFGARVTAEIWMTFAVLAGAVYLFVTEKLPVDVVAMLVLVTVMVLGLVTPREALSGFSSEATITVAAMFVLSAGIQHSGILSRLSDLLSRIKRLWLFTLVMMLLAAATSAFINNTAVVAVFLPLVMTAAAAVGQAPSKMLIPLSYAAQFGGVCTLVGTSTNLLVHSVAQQSGLPGFGLFEFTQLGIWFTLIGTAYMLLAGKFLLPAHPAPNREEDEHQGRWLVDLYVNEKSPAVGKLGSTVIPVDITDAYLLEVYRNGNTLSRPRAAEIKAGDRLLVRGTWEQIEKVRKSLKLQFDEVARDLVANPAAERVHAEVLVAPGSPLVNRTLTGLRFGHIHRVRVHGLQRPGHTLRQPLHKIPLNVGDTLLVDGTPESLETLRNTPGLILTRERVQPRVHRLRAMTSVGIMVAAVALAAFEIMPIVVSSLLGCVALVILRALTPERAYGGIDWRVIVLLAGVLPLGIALQNSGGAQWVANNTLALIASGNPLLTLAAIYLLTSVMTEMMSNNASAVLIAPIAIATAETLGLDPKPFLVAVAFAASTSFSTPVGYQTNTMVYTAGGYRFSDFLKVGIPLNILFFLAAIFLIPRYFPF